MERGRLTPSPRAFRTRRTSRTNFCRPTGSSENAWSVPFMAWLSVKCFSMTRAPSTYADDRHRDPAEVIRQADHDFREALTVGRDDAQVDVLRLAGYAAVHWSRQRLGLTRHHDVMRAAHVVDGRSAGAHDHRLAELGHVSQQRRVVEVAGRDLEGGHVELGEEVGAGAVEHRGEEGDADLSRELPQLGILVAPELEQLAVLAVRRGRSCSRSRTACRRRRGVIQRPVVALLELDGVHTALLRHVEQLLRLLDVALVVVPDLGDDVAVRLVGDRPAIDD